MLLVFGAGGRMVEVIKDRAIGLPPLTTTLARRVMERTRIFTALKARPGRPAIDLARLEEVFVRFSQLVAELRWIKEIDVNPLLVSSDHIVALDARTGTLLWRAALGGQLNSGPMSFQVEGRQYVTVAAGNALFAFGLK